MTNTMNPPTGLRRTELTDLSRRVTGRLTTPADQSWEIAKTPWVVNVPQRPLGVLEVHDVDDVIEAVRWAVDHGLQVTAQPTGHGANDALEGAVLLRTGSLGGVSIDLDRRTAWVGAGVKAGELTAALDGTGLTFLAGSNPDPTVVGMTITGGISWFSRAYGLGSDSIVGVELVDGLGKLRHLSAEQDPELFWAVRGGGGDFGIITRLEVALHPAAELYGGQLMWPADRMHDVLTAFRDLTRTAPDKLTVWFHTWSFPPLTEVPEPIRGRSFTGVAVTHLGSPAQAEGLLATLRAVDGLEVDSMRPITLNELASVTGEPTDPMPGMQRSRLLHDLDDATISALVDAVGPSSGSPLPDVQIRHLGGAFARPTDGSHGAVTEQYNLFALGVPAVPELVDVIRTYFDRAEQAVAGVASGRVLLNFLEPGEDSALWRTEETRKRLVRAKEESDPLRIIRSNRPVN